MSDEIDDILTNALKAQKELTKLGDKTVAKYSMHLDKVDPEIKKQFEGAAKNIDSLKKELSEELDNLDNLKNKL